MRRDWTRLFLRSFAARGSAAGIRLADGIGTASEEADHPSIRPSNDSENAWEDCFRLLEEHWNGHGLGGVPLFHREVKHAERALAMGFMISFAGNITFPKAQNIRDAAKIVPLDRFFTETDCPYLAPVPLRGKRNEPAFVVETARHFGELRGLSREEIGRLGAENFYRFFNLNS